MFCSFSEKMSIGSAVINNIAVTTRNKGIFKMRQCFEFIN